MEKVLMVNNLYKKIGNKKIIKDLNLTLNKGKVLGILGPNGKGKTTLLNIISGIKKATSGDVLIDGIKVSSETKKSVSFLQERNTLSNWMTIKDAVEFYKDFFQDFNEEKVKELLAFMNLDEKLKIKSLSKGMLEKLHLSLTLSRKAKLYILDEGKIIEINDAEVLREKYGKSIEEIYKYIFAE